MKNLFITMQGEEVKTLFFPIRRFKKINFPIFDIHQILTNISTGLNIQPLCDINICQKMDNFQRDISPKGLTYSLSAHD